MVPGIGSLALTRPFLRGSCLSDGYVQIAVVRWRTGGLMLSACSHGLNTRPKLRPLNLQHIICNFLFRPEEDGIWKTLNTEWAMNHWHKKGAPKEKLLIGGFSIVNFLLESP